MAANDVAYIEQTYEGGIEAYKASHDARFAAAVASGDTAMMAKLQADANRVGFSLSPVGGGAVSPSGISKYGSMSIGGGLGDKVQGAPVAAAPVAVSGGLSDLGIKSGASDLLPVVLVGAFVVFIVKAIFN